MVEAVDPALDDDAGGRGIGGEWAVEVVGCDGAVGLRRPVTVPAAEALAASGR